MLARISREYYGKKEYWKFVWRQNSEITNPDLIAIGSVLYLSPLEFNKSLGEFSKISYEKVFSMKSQFANVKKEKV